MLVPVYYGNCVTCWCKTTSLKNIYVYIFLVKPADHIKRVRFFHFIIALVFIFDATQTGLDGFKDGLFLGLFSGSAVLLVVQNLFNKKFRTTLDAHFNVLQIEAFIFSAAAIYFWSKGHNLVAASHFLLSAAIVLFWYYLKKRKDGEQIMVNDEGITTQNIFNDRKISWSEVSNVVKNADLLTIDFKNNKILQVEVDMKVDEKEFNEFCSGKVNGQ